MNRTLRTFVIRLHSVSGGSRARVRTKMIGGWAIEEREPDESKKEGWRLCGVRVWWSVHSKYRITLMMMSPHVRVHARPPKPRSRGERRVEERTWRGWGPNSRGKLLDFEVLSESQTVRHRQLPLELLSYRRFNRIDDPSTHSLA